MQALKNDIRNRGLEHPVIFAPGLQRLPFFFPLDDVRIDQAPSDLDRSTAWITTSTRRRRAGCTKNSRSRRSIKSPDQCTAPN
ncbi:MAG: hypothetical protein HND48_26435 [Chloroflexi bacterium]|nr:hypothetical protein [Chloroflexota bacterium]